MFSGRMSQMVWNALILKMIYCLREIQRKLDIRYFAQLLHGPDEETEAKQEGLT